MGMAMKAPPVATCMRPCWLGRVNALTSDGRVTYGSRFGLISRFRNRLTKINMVRFSESGVKCLCGDRRSTTLFQIHYVYYHEQSWFGDYVSRSDDLTEPRARVTASTP
jgi:hypothetical protein